MVQMEKYFQCVAKLCKMITGWSITPRWTQSSGFSMGITRNHCYFRNIYIAVHANQYSVQPVLIPCPYHASWCLGYLGHQGPDSILRCHLISIGNPIVGIRRSYDHLISTMGFPILIRRHLYIESGPRLSTDVSPTMQKVRFLPSLRVNFHYRHHFIVDRFDIKLYSHVSCKQFRR